jgi:hypothetical protein
MEIVSERTEIVSQRGLVVQGTTNQFLAKGDALWNPMKKTSENRTSALRIRLTGAEHAAISAAATTQGIGICTFARLVTLRAAGLTDSRQKRRKPTEMQRIVAECIGQLGHIGNNVN